MKIIGSKVRHEDRVTTEIKFVKFVWNLDPPSSYVKWIFFLIWPFTHSFSIYMHNIHLHLCFEPFNHQSSFLLLSWFLPVFLSSILSTKQHKHGITWVSLPNINESPNSHGLIQMKHKHLKSIASRNGSNQLEIILIEPMRRRQGNYHNQNWLPISPHRTSPKSKANRTPNYHNQIHSQFPPIQPDQNRRLTKPPFITLKFTPNLP